MRKMLVMIGLFGLMLAACGQADSTTTPAASAATPASASPVTAAPTVTSPTAAPTAVPATAAPTAVPVPTVAPAASAAPSMPSAPVPPDAQPLAALAQAALASELGIGAGAVTLVSAEATEWRDSSLGCPQPGMNYMQVITPGYTLMLEAQGQRYEYHSDMNNRVVRC